MNEASAMIEECKWEWDEEDHSFDTGCGHIFRLLEECEPTDFNANFCLYCGAHVDIAI